MPGRTTTISWPWAKKKQGGKITFTVLQGKLRCFLYLSPILFLSVLTCCSHGVEQYAKMKNACQMDYAPKKSKWVQLTLQVIPIAEIGNALQRPPDPFENAHLSLFKLGKQHRLTKNAIVRLNRAWTDLRMGQNRCQNARIVLQSLLENK